MQKILNTVVIVSFPRTWQVAKSRVCGLSRNTMRRKTCATSLQEAGCLSAHTLHALPKIKNVSFICYTNHKYIWANYVLLKPRCVHSNIEKTSGGTRSQKVWELLLKGISQSGGQAYRVHGDSHRSAFGKHKAHRTGCFHYCIFIWRRRLISVRRKYARENSLSSQPRHFSTVYKERYSNGAWKFYRCKRNKLKKNNKIFFHCFKLCLNAGGGMTDTTQRYRSAEKIYCSAEVSEAGVAHKFPSTKDLKNVSDRSRRQKAIRGTKILYSKSSNSTWDAETGRLQNERITITHRATFNGSVHVLSTSFTDWPFLVSYRRIIQNIPKPERNAALHRRLQQLTLTEFRHNLVDGRCHLYCPERRQEQPDAISLAPPCGRRTSLLRSRECNGYSPPVSKNPFC